MTTQSQRLFTIGEEEVNDEVLVLTLTGELDLHAAPALDEHLTNAFAATTRRAIIDMRAVTFIDSTAIAVLLRVARQRIVSIVCENRRVLDVFEIVGLDRMSPMFATLDEALEARQLSARFGPSRDFDTA